MQEENRTWNKMGTWWDRAAGKSAVGLPIKTPEKINLAATGGFRALPAWLRSLSRPWGQPAALSSPPGDEGRGSPSPIWSGAQTPPGLSAETRHSWSTGRGGGQPPSAPLPCLCCGSGTGWHLWCPQPPAGLLSTLWGCSLFGGTLQTQVWHGNILQPARAGRALAVLPPWLSPLWGRSILGGQQPPCALWCMQPSHTQPYRCCLGLGGPAGARCHLGLGSSWPRCK